MVTLPESKNVGLGDVGALPGSKDDRETRPGKGSSSASVATQGAHVTLEAATVMLSAEQGEIDAEDNEEYDLSLKVVPQGLGLEAVGRRLPKFNDGPFENPSRLHGRVPDRDPKGSKDCHDRRS